MARITLSGLFNPSTALALLAGAVVVQMFTTLPPVAWIFALLGCGVLLACARPPLRWLGIALLGMAWTLWRADAALAQRLPVALEGEEVLVVGALQGLPRIGEEPTRFDLAIESARHHGSAVALEGIVRVAWYTNAPSIQPCERWRLLLRVRRPRGLVDPGAFDFERHALEAGIHALGYVREDARNERLGERALCIDRLRARVSQGIAETLGAGAPADLLRALAFGDQQAMDEREWAVARATGIPHLIAISGLHIALFAGFGVIFVRGLWKLFPRVTLRWPAPQIEALASIAFALSYGCIAGLGLPTRRALVMIGVLLAANLARRAHASVQGLAFAVVVLLAIDPACVLSAGFWLSFVGVAWLIFCLGGRGTVRHGWREMMLAQGVASIGLLPLTVWFFGQSSLVGPLANLVAVPAICFFILPAAVAGALLQLAIPWFGAPLLHLAGVAMSALWWLLERMAEWPAALCYFEEPRAWSLVLAVLGALWLLAPRGVPGRVLGAALLLPLLVPARERLGDGEFEALMLDVGQGLSFVVRTREHVLVYDAGARFPSGFDLGEAAVVPTLHALGVARVDRLVISHGDNDHAGGAAAVLAAFPATPVSSGDPQRLPMAATQCLAGEHWRWDGVDFRVLHPRAPLSARDNDRCCVIEVRSGSNALLLTGDITAAVEGDVAEALQPFAANTVLQVAHHGSRTSSSVAFVAALRPRIALISAGYRNRFHHPHADVVSRYAASGSAILVSAEAGFVRLRFAPDAPPDVVEIGRRDRHPYWRE
ncbi:MAG: DNA internalization-related competence protein ComEC/Rec2 [Rudaea sp.]